MIRYSLKCADGHVFESWFRSGPAFDTLTVSGMVNCPECGSTEITKALMAPKVSTAEPKRPLGTHAMAAPASKAEAAISELRRRVQDHSEYVGNRFASEARAIHVGDAPERSIYGEASQDEARELVDDGVPVAPLPFVPGRKAN